MAKTGLVLAGGGGKGAFEIGVMKALLENNIPIDTVSGTSVGALNAALYTLENNKMIENIWKTEVNEDTILCDSNIKMDENQYIELLMEEQEITNTGKRFKFIKMKNVKTVIRAAKNLKKHGMDGAFNRNGIDHILQKYNICENVRKSSKNIYCTCCCGIARTEYFNINKMSIYKIEKVLKASSAILLIFPPEQIDGHYYIDGGTPLIGDNLPIKPLIEEEKCEQLIIVHLSPKWSLDFFDVVHAETTRLMIKKLIQKYGFEVLSLAVRSMVNPIFFYTKNIVTVLELLCSPVLIKKTINRLEYFKYTARKVKMINIYPSKDLGNLITGTIEFDSQRIRENINLGYQDAMKKMSTMEKWQNERNVH